MHTQGHKYTLKIRQYCKVIEIDWSERFKEGKNKHCGGSCEICLLNRRGSDENVKNAKRTFSRVITDNRPIRDMRTPPFCLHE